MTQYVYNTAVPFYLPMSTSVLNWDICYLGRNLHSLYFLTNCAGKKNRAKEILLSTCCWFAGRRSNTKDIKSNFTHSLQTPGQQQMRRVSRNNFAAQLYFMGMAQLQSSCSRGLALGGDHSRVQDLCCRNPSNKKVIRPSRSITMSK